MKKYIHLVRKFGIPQGSRIFCAWSAISRISGALGRAEAAREPRGSGSRRRRKREDVRQGLSWERASEEHIVVADLAGTLTPCRQSSPSSPFIFSSVPRLHLESLDMECTFDYGVTFPRLTARYVLPLAHQPRRISCFPGISLSFLRAVLHVFPRLFRRMSYFLFYLFRCFPLLGIRSIHSFPTFPEFLASC